MSTLPPPGPDGRAPGFGGDRRPLSDRERRAFDRIADELAGAGPAFPGRAGSGDEAPPGYATVRLPPRRAWIVAVVLIVGLSIVVQAPASWWALLALLTVMIGVPWLLLSATERRRRK